MKTIGCSFILLLALSSNTLAIVDGQVAGINEYQSVGSVISGGGGLGSFVALSSTWVLTAAHVVDNDPNAILIAGHQDAPGGEAFFFAEQVILHPDYVAGEFHDDLALIKLSDFDPIVPSAHNISFATLSNVALPTNIPMTATVTGWGQDTVDGPVADDFEFVRRFTTVNTDTADPFATVGVMPFPTSFPTACAGGQILCTYGTNGGAQGVSGGGIFLDYGGGEVVAAINSFLFDENDIDPNIPLDWTNAYWTVGTSVAAYRAWIEEPETGVFTNAQFAAAPVPLPGAIWLIGSALSGVFAAQRNRKRGNRMRHSGKQIFVNRVSADSGDA
ncbi:MAG: trypsin-like serine protease [Proteobacteria bacterium]|nr:trypsin-like serine protease [Pseudomonadota bacterium]